MFVLLVLEERIAYERGVGFGTAKLILPLRIFELSEANDSSIVDLRRLPWNSLSKTLEIKGNENLPSRVIYLLPSPSSPQSPQKSRVKKDLVPQGHEVQSLGIENPVTPPMAVETRNIAD